MKKQVAKKVARKLAAKVDHFGLAVDLVSGGDEPWEGMKRELPELNRTQRLAVLWGLDGSVDRKRISEFRENPESLPVRADADLSKLREESIARRESVIASDLEHQIFMVLRYN
ncbi:hypothetical protein LG299_12610 [Microbacterium lacus]|uniref:hypothetical protein n=1 Tax=Microbacterium lacus TaxID=415217 RepID=UPI00384E6CA5